MSWKLNFNHYLINHSNSSSDLLKYFILSLLFVLFILGYYVLRFSSNINQYKFLIQEEKKLKVEFKAKQNISNLDAYQKQLIDLNKIYQEKIMMLSQSNEIQDLLNVISQIGLSLGLKFEFFAPKTEVKDGFQNTVSLSLVLLGEYHNLILFLSGISALEKLIVFEEIEISREDMDSDNLKYLRMKVRVKIYKIN